MDYTIPIGSSTLIKSGFLSSVSIFYSGMISENIFAISVQDVTRLGNAFVPLYFPIKTEEITIRGISFSVKSVSPESITLVRK